MLETTTCTFEGNNKPSVALNLSAAQIATLPSLGNSIFSIFSLKTASSIS